MYCALAARALSKAAGRRLQEACTQYVAKNGPLTEGGIAVTDAYNLPAKKVLHVWCPKTAEVGSIYILRYLSFSAFLFYLGTEETCRFVPYRSLSP